MVLATILHFILAAGMLAVFAAGIQLCRVGVRGRRVGSHPLCARCGYDLHLLAPRGARCPECGTRHGLEDADPGRRRARRLPLAAGIALMAISTMPIALAGCFDSSRSAAPGTTVHADPDQTDFRR